ncbi:MAG: PaaI family thioesterase [Oscillospiraceae bacterium]|nr:PaaI family thioesterase [Oscillospiraceae bacterium]
MSNNTENKNLEIIRNYFKGDVFAMEAGVQIDFADEQTARCSMEIKPGHRNAMGNVQGGAVFTLTDLVFAVASNYTQLVEEGIGNTVGQSVSISYIKATRGTKLFATATKLQKGRSVSVYLVEVVDDLGQRISEAICNGFTIQKR